MSDFVVFRKVAFNYRTKRYSGAGSRFEFRNNLYLRYARAGEHPYKMKICFPWCLRELNYDKF